jgi:hypothetical protein
LCHYHQSGDARALDQALADLRIADAKHRLAYVQSRAAMIDLGRNGRDDALVRATEALACAELLQRPTEMLIARTVLYRANASSGDQAAMHEHAEAMRKLCQAGAATWACAQAGAVLEHHVPEES